MNIDLHEVANVLNELFNEYKCFVRDNNCHIHKYNAHVALQNNEEVLIIDTD